MKGAEGGNNLIGSVQIELPVAAGELDCPLISFSAAIAEKDLVQTAILDQKLGQANLGNSIELV